jgi:hypothetical protein
MDWIDLAQDKNQWRPFVNTEMNFRVPLSFVKFSSDSEIGSFSRRTQLQGVS